MDKQIKKSPAPTLKSKIKNLSDENDGCDDDSDAEEEGTDASEIMKNMIKNI